MKENFLLFYWSWTETQKNNVFVEVKAETTFTSAG